MSRRRARELALIVLFQWDVGRQDPHNALSRALLEEDLPDNSRQFARELVQGTLEHINFIDDELRKYLEDWRLERLANVDRNVLRIAVFELRFLRDIPLSVSINEAVEIAKVYGGPDSGKFVNGILGRMAETLLESMATSEGMPRGIQPAPGVTPGPDTFPGAEEQKYCSRPDDDPTLEG